ncbi:hypothetical protein B0T20DRAFT_76780 [Sordaria brevicollis]|uniref:Uncharacterized protein n=1 Tax=Sordaria brevicollis TaxID=83679 RepID=A0AAE0P0T6_SORBR|nr:hypothetical protein B0T20DRAFT_76780 [Sordaria brevicollis]
MAGRNAKMPGTSNGPKPSPPHAVTMPTKNGNAAASEPSNTPKPSNRPTLPSKDSSTASSFDTTRAIQGSSGCLSEPSKSGNSTDSSDQPLAASRPQGAQTSEPPPAEKKKKDKGKQRATDSPPPPPPKSKTTVQATAHGAQPPRPSDDQPPPPKKPGHPRAGYLFIRGKVATCGCLYLIEVGPKGFATLRDLKKAGFPRHGHHCAKCKYVTAEIRFDAKGKAVVTEIDEARPPSPDRENDVSSEGEENPENYMDGDYMDEPYYDEEYEYDEEMMGMYGSDDMYGEEEESYYGGHDPES